MYDQSIEFQSGSSTRGGGGGNDRPTDRCGELPHLKLVTDGNGNVRPLGNTTDNSAIRTQQGFQAIKNRFKLLDSARKILDGQRTQHCFYNRVDKNDGVGSHLINFAIKPIIRTSCAVQMRGAVLFVLQLSQNIVNAKSKKPWTGGRNKADLCCFLPLLFPIIQILTLNN